MKKRLLSLALALMMCVSLLSVTPHAVYALGGGGTVTVTGTVSDGDGNEISGASVKYETGGTSSVTVSTTTDGSGYYELTDVPKNTEGTFTVSKDGYDSVESNEDFDQDTAKNITLNVKTYRATFDLNGGTRNDPEEDWACKLGYGYTPSTSTYFKEFNYGTGYSTILAEWNNYTPTKTGYVFDGWTPNSGTLTEATTFTATYKSNKTAQTLTFTGVTNDAVTKTYGDAKFTQAVTGANTTVTYSSSDTGVATVNSSTGEVTILKAGTTTIKASAAENDTYAAAEKSYTLTIAKKAVTITGSTADGKKYDGTKTATVHLGTVSGIITGDDATVNISGEFDKAEPDNEINVTLTYTLTGAKAGNYEISSNSNYTTIADIEKGTISYTVDDSIDTKYDGNAHTISVNVTDPTSGTTISYSDDGGATWNTGSSYSLTNAGEKNIKFKIEANYYTTVTTDAKTIKISKRTVTLTSESDSKVYDGNVFTNSNVAFGGDDFVAGESVNIAFSETSKITKPGSVENRFTYEALGSTNLNNYTITPSYGTLTVTAPPIDTSKSSNVTLDGNKLTASFKQKNASSLVIDIDSSVPAIANCAAGLYNENSVKVCDCTCEAGSIKVTVPTSYLNTLSAGTHDLSLGITDTTTGEIVYTYDLSITVNANPVSSNDAYNVVNTGVSGTGSAIKLVSLLSLVTIAGAVTLKKRKH